jgi:hypothetical protein
MNVYTQGIHAAMSVPMALLGLLEREPSHGYDLKRDYDAYFGRGKLVGSRPAARRRCALVRPR